VGGIDFGYTHNFSVSELLVVKPWAIVFDFFESAVLELVDRHVLRLAEIRKAGPEKRREFGGL
jgi:hypothetical protein